MLCERRVASAYATMPKGPNAETISIMSAKASGKPKPTDATLTEPRVINAQKLAHRVGTLRGACPAQLCNALSQGECLRIKARCFSCTCQGFAFFRDRGAYVRRARVDFCAGADREPTVPRTRSFATIGYDKSVAIAASILRLVDCAWFSFERCEFVLRVGV